MRGIVGVEKAFDPSLPFLLNTLWRPRLVISTGNTRGWPAPDVVLRADSASDDGDASAADLVEAMHRNVVGQFELATEGVCA